ncbi:hypothetical protein DdX_21732 [Ditylenchus destructor]|uniref:Uncharacterized protein n=1 Tax=Ditylenchus destructor TaxID=166010 RepID=A0AAD4QVA4_9BILA|nr:hypothetical protein DdX_21732 [Ditylenchus destructor]
MQHSFTRICFVLLVTATVLVIGARLNIDSPGSEGPENDDTPSVERKMSGGNKVIGGTGTNSGRKSGKCKSKTNSCPAKDKTTNIKFVWEFVVRILAVQHNIQLIANPGPNQLMLYDHTVPKTNSLQQLNGQSDTFEMKFDPSEKVHLYVDQKEVTTDFCEYDCDAKVCNCNVAFKYEENEVQTSDAHRTVQVPGYIKFVVDTVYRFVKW